MITYSAFPLLRNQAHVPDLDDVRRIARLARPGRSAAEPRRPRSTQRHLSFIEQLQSSIRPASSGCPCVTWCSACARRGGGGRAANASRPSPPTTEGGLYLVPRVSNDQRLPQELSTALAAKKTSAVNWPRCSSDRIGKLNPMLTLSSPSMREDPGHGARGPCSEKSAPATRACGYPVGAQGYFLHEGWRTTCGSKMLPLRFAL